MAEKKVFNPVLHPIQLISLNVEELFIKVRVAPESTDLSSGYEQFSLRTGRSDYDEGSHIIKVGVKLEIGGEGKEAPFDMRIVISGVFNVDESKFAKVNIDDWAKRNAPIILYPYLREQAFALTTRCGYPGLILPLLEVPVFKLEAPKKPVRTKPKPKTVN